MRLNHPSAAIAFRAIARAFGETVRIEPMVSSEYAEAVVDTSRPVTTVRAAVALSPSVSSLDGIRGTSTLGLREARIWITPSDYVGIGYELRSGDRVILVERPSEPAYIVTRAPESSDRGDVTAYLVIEKS